MLKKYYKQQKNEIILSKIKKSRLRINKNDLRINKKVFFKNKNQ